MIRSITLGMLGAALMGPVANAQVSATLEAGYDSNPFRLAGAFDRQESAFLDGEIRLEHAFENGFAFDGRVTHLASGADNGDQTGFSATFSYENESQLFGKPTEWLFHVRGSGNDRTFISRGTGEVGEFLGDAIPDRFDQVSLEARARADIELAEDVFLRLQGDGRTRTYEDYSSLGLSNLDYSQVYAHARLRYWPERTHDGQLGISVGYRVYDDRRGRALDTGFVPGSDLEFTYFNLDASWKHELNPDHDVRIAYSYDVREDNVTGYYDTTLHRTRLRYRYIPDWSNRVSAEIEYRDFTFDNIPTALIFNEEENVAPSDGVRLTLSWDRRLHRSDGREVWFQTSLFHDDFDSPNQSFIYDRTVFRIGFVVELGEG